MRYFKDGINTGRYTTAPSASHEPTVPISGCGACGDYMPVDGLGAGEGPLGKSGPWLMVGVFFGAVILWMALAPQQARK